MRRRSLRETFDLCLCQESSTFTVTEPQRSAAALRPRAESISGPVPSAGSIQSFHSRVQQLEMKTHADIRLLLLIIHHQHHRHSLAAERTLSRTAEPPPPCNYTTRISLADILAHLTGAVL